MLAMPFCSRIFSLFLSLYVRPRTINPTQGRQLLPSAPIRSSRTLPPLALSMRRGRSSVCPSCCALYMGQAPPSVSPHYRPSCRALSMSPSICPYLCRSFSLIPQPDTLSEPIRLTICTSVRQSVRQSVRLFVFQSIYMSICSLVR